MPFSAVNACGSDPELVEVSLLKLGDRIRPDGLRLIDQRIAGRSCAKMPGPIGVLQVQSVRHYFAMTVHTSALERTGYPMHSGHWAEGFIGIVALLLRHKTNKKPVAAVIAAPYRNSCSIRCGKARFQRGIKWLSCFGLQANVKNVVSLYLRHVSSSQNGYSFAPLVSMMCLYSQAESLMIRFPVVKSTYTSPNRGS